MRFRIVAYILVICMVLSGCGGWMDGSFSSVKPHTQRENQVIGETATAGNYEQMRQLLAELVKNGGENIVVNIEEMKPDTVDDVMDQVSHYILQVNPVGAYAVTDLKYEQGTNAGKPSLAVTISYNQNWVELRKMKEADSMDEARQIVADALAQCESKVVIWVNHYRSLDFEQYIRDYMTDNPQTVMEMPQVTVSTYPETGAYRMVEIVCNYKTDRDDLKNMQTRVRPLFTSAELYVSGNSNAHDKYALLYAFLMERHDYQLDASITPTYSLLIHGVGDSRAFATVYAAMCRNANLECRIVSGTKNGESLFWNIIRIDGKYYHLDLLESSLNGEFTLRGDEEMAGYVWDYSAYPKCVVYVDPNQMTEPIEEPSEDPTEETLEDGEAESPETEPTEN